MKYEIQVKNEQGLEVSKRPTRKKKKTNCCCKKPKGVHFRGKCKDPQNRDPVTNPATVLGSKECHDT